MRQYPVMHLKKKKKKAETGRLGAKGPSIQLSPPVSIVPTVGGQNAMQHPGIYICTTAFAHQDPCSRCTTLLIMNLVSTVMDPYSFVSPQCSSRIERESTERRKHCDIYGGSSPSGKVAQSHNIFVPRKKASSLISFQSIYCISSYLAPYNPSRDPLRLHPSRYQSHPYTPPFGLRIGLMYRYSKYL